MTKIVDIVGKEIQEGNTVLIYNEKQEKWSLELVIEEDGKLYSEFKKLYSNIRTDLSILPKSYIIRMYNETKRDFVYSRDFNVEEIYPIDNNGIYNLIQKAKNDNPNKMTEKDYKDFFQKYKGQYDETKYEEIISETLKKQKNVNKL